MPRAPRQCPHPGCNNRITNTRYCPEHTTHHWTSDPRPPEHYRWRRAILTRDHYRCQIRGPHCTGRATDADHITPIAEGGAPYDPTNGQAACPSCHKAKTQTEATRGLQRRYRNGT